MCKLDSNDQHWQNVYAQVPKYPASVVSMYVGIAVTWIRAAWVGTAGSQQQRYQPLLIGNNNKAGKAS